jgi:hypothetical protein
MTLPLKLKYSHAVIIARREIVERWVSCEDPEPVCVLALLVDLNAPVQVPDPQGLVL